MSKALDLILLLSAIVLLCVVTPITIERKKVDFLKQSHCAFEADQLAWEIQTFQKIDTSAIPSSMIEFHCYNENMEEVAILTAGDDLDFTPYFCVIFSHASERRGVYIE